jgi:plasmid stabilization system protein ParE
VKVLYRERALADIEDIFLFLNERSPTGARNVLRAVHEAIGEIAAHPLAAPRTSDPGIRVKTLGRYRYKIFYGVVDEEFVEIIHVRHAARRPWIRDSR